MLFRSFLGLGNCSFHPVDFSILNSKVSNERIGYAYSTHGLCGNLGWAIAPVFMLFIAETLSWRMSYVAAGIFFSLILLLLWLARGMMVSPTQVSSNGSDHESLHFLKNANVWWCFAFFVFSTMTLSVVQSFGVSILQRMHDAVRRVP